jgi:cytochrome c556
MQGTTSVTHLPRGVRVPLAVFAVLTAAWGCSKEASPAPGGPAGGDSRARQIMRTIGQGSESLSSRLDQGLRSDAPDWGAIQTQAAEYARLAPELGLSEPAKGSKESWAKLTASFADSATALEAAAKKKDLTACRAAQKSLTDSCMACHREHRGRPGPPAK